MTDTTIPEYFVYGEKSRALEAGFLHVELVSARYVQHRGKVAPHKHPGMAQITFWFKGSGTYFIDDETWSFSAPAASLVLADTVHGFEIKPGSDAIVLSLESATLEAILADAGWSYPRTVFARPRQSEQHWPALRQAMRSVLEEYTNQQTQWGSVVSHHAAVALINLMRICVAEQGEDSAAPAQPLAQRLKAIVNLHFRENWPIEKYAGELGASGHTALRAAKRAYGSTIKNLIIQRRLLEAKRLLAFTIRSAEDISYELGFRDPAYFNREFKRHTGLAPGLWRKANLRP